MSFVTVSGSALDEPSFLELIAAQRLERSFKDAFWYSLSILSAHSRQRAFALLSWDNELYLMASLLVQGTSLLSNDASIAESLYGLHRVPVKSPAETSTPARRSLSPWQRALSLMFVAAAPYSVHLLFGEVRQVPLSVVRHNSGEAERQSSSSIAAESTPSVYGAKHTLQLAWVTAKSRAQWAIAEARRHGHVTVGLACVAYQLLYLLNVTPYSSPSLHLIGARLARDDGGAREGFRIALGDGASQAIIPSVFWSGQAVVPRRRSSVLRIQQQQAARQAIWQRALDTRAPLLFLMASLLRIGHAVGNNAQTALMTGLLSFKVLEWWFTTAEEELEAAARTVPPPPPMYSPHVQGVRLPDDTSLCPVCKKARAAPALLATSGYVFCYKCIFDAVSQYGRCPVTRIRGSPDEIRRLFLSS